MSEMLPLFPLSTVLFPGMRLPLHIFEQRYRQLVADLLERPEPRQFGVIAIRKGRETGVDGVTALHEVGCVATVREVAAREDGRYDLQTVGAQRFRLLRLNYASSLPYFQAEIESLPDTMGDAAAAAYLAQRVQQAFRGYLNALADRGGGTISVTSLPDEPELLSYVVGAAMIIDLPDRQALLAAPDTVGRLRAERALLTRETAMLRATTSRAAPDFNYEPYSPN
jgi:Lon protease-like protein